MKVRLPGQPWAATRDTDFACLLPGKHSHTTIAKALASQLGWTAVVDEMEIQLQMQDRVTTLVAKVAEAACPSITLGDDVLRWLVREGWTIDEEAWTSGVEPQVPPEVKAQQLQWGNAEDLMDAGLVEQAILAAEGDQEWSALVDMAQTESVVEDGALVSHEEHAPDESVLREAWRGLPSLLKHVEEGKEISSGPSYTEPCDNPAQFLGRKTPFVPGGVHSKLEAWRNMDPPPDREVLAWIEKGYEVKMPPEAEGIRCKNGKVARANEEALQLLLLKRIKEGSWEITNATVNIIPANLTPKEGAEIPWRLVLNAIPLNEYFYTWRIKYEGLKTVPLTVKQDDWLFSVDYESGVRCSPIARSMSRSVWSESSAYSKAST